MDDNKSEEEMDDNESEEEMDDNDEERDSDEEVCKEGDGDSAEVSSGGELEEEDTDCVTPTDTFERLLTFDLVSHILTETNRSTLMTMLIIWLHIPELELMTFSDRNSALQRSIGNIMCTYNNYQE